jgi:hypothetical protein
MSNICIKERFYNNRRERDSGGGEGERERERERESERERCCKLAKDGGFF